MRKIPSAAGLPDHLNPDYHTTEGCGVFMYHLGILSIDWNWCEHMFASLIWSYIGGIEKGLLVTPAIGNQSRADILLGLVRQYERSKKTICAFEFAAKAFNRLREIRNILMHSHSVRLHKSGKLEWVRMSSKGPYHMIVLIGIDEFVDIFNSVGELVLYITELSSRNLAKRNGLRPPPLPGIFPLPDIPTQLPHSSQRASSRRRRSSPASRRSVKPQHGVG